MTKELQDQVWPILPKEFKEEVKFEYLRVATKASKEEYDLGFMHAHEGMFGIHNLTSDAEGEEDEMLYVSRKKLQYFYKSLRRVGKNQAAFALQSLFGSKCLPDDTATVATQAKKATLSEPAEPQMDELNQEAMLRAWCEYRGMEYVEGHVRPLPSDNFEKGFRMAVDKIMALPLVQRITAKEREKITEIYDNLQARIHDIEEVDDHNAAIFTYPLKAQIKLLEDVFGGKGAFRALFDKLDG